MPSLSVCMIVQNAEKTLAIALESLDRIYDELIIVDGGSTDKTGEIALKYGATIINSPWTGNHFQQRNIYLREIKTDWVFFLDSDEFIDKKTLDFLQTIKNQENMSESDNFWLPRKWISPFSKSHYIANKPHYPDPQRRLFKYNQNVFHSGKIHITIHGLKHTGFLLQDLSIYHLDLFINSESYRMAKVRLYSQETLRDGMPEFYLPEISTLQLKRWKDQDVIPSVKKMLDSLPPMKCKICESESANFANEQILNKYYIDYFRCSSCGFIQTEEPYWLKEAYSSPIAKSDVGIVYRNTNFAQITSNIILAIFNHEGQFLDYGGGYGLFVRMMRDIGFDFYWYDIFCPNLFARGFEAEQQEDTRYELVTAFEVFEHFVNPLSEIEKILKFSRNILFSTELLPESNPKPHEWWYYAPEEGQHISLYTKDALTFIAQKYNLNLYSRGSFLHLLTENQLSPVVFENLFCYESQGLKKESLISTDYLKALGKIVSKENQIKLDIQEHTVLESNPSNLKIIVDGVFFQLYKTGIARVWHSLLEEWASNGFGQYLIVLDRDETAPKIPSIQYRSVQRYDYDATNEDREILQQICDEEGANLFISTYYTTPLYTPSVFLAHDMIPELIGWNLDHPMWREKHYGIRHASAYIAVSENTAHDLLNFFPDISQELVTVAYNGVKSTFSPASLEDVNRFKTKYAVSKPYFMHVGAGGSYKNTILFLQAFARLFSSQGFDIVCTGSGSILDSEYRTYTSGSAVHMLQLADEELSVAYSGAVALVYPSKYEGFGLPVLEAMACGCPVITCPNGPIPEVAGKAALYVKDDDVNGMVNALCDVQKPDVRKSLIVAGLEQAKKFSWSKMAETISSVLVETTLLPLKLSNINLIIFPDWSQPEESLGTELEQIMRSLATHPDSYQMTLLIYANGTCEENANLLVSGVAMNLLMQEDLDLTEGLEISLVKELAEIQWNALFHRLTARLMLDNENQQEIAKVKAGSLPSCDLDSLLEMRTLQ